MRLLRSLPVPLGLAFLPAAALAGPAGDTGGRFVGIVLTLVLAVLVTILVAPHFYRRALEKRGEKDLTRFLLNDPATRDALLEAKGGKKKPAAGGADQPQQ